LKRISLRISYYIQIIELKEWSEGERWAKQLQLKKKNNNEKERAF
jgi:hypothetical protein